MKSRQYPARSKAGNALQSRSKERSWHSPSQNKRQQNWLYSLSKAREQIADRCFVRVHGAQLVRVFPVRRRDMPYLCAPVSPRLERVQPRPWPTSKEFQTGPRHQKAMLAAYNPLHPFPKLCAKPLNATESILATSENVPRFAVPKLFPYHCRTPAPNSHRRAL